MTIQTTITELQKLNRVVEGIRSAPDKYPAALNTANLPLCLTWPGSGVYSPLVTRALKRKMERTYSVRVYLEPVGQSNTSIPFETGVGLLDSFLTLYMENRTLANGYIQIQRIEDSGLIAGGELTYAGIEYRGFVLRLNVIEVNE
jgi:hypothetical protein